MKFAYLVYPLVLALLLPPPHVFAAAPAPSLDTYVGRLGAVIEEAHEREKELAQLISKGAYCGPKSWAKVCGNASAGSEVSSLAEDFKRIRIKLVEVRPAAQKLDAKVSADKIAGTTSCKGGAGGLAAYEEESKKAAEEIRPVLADAVNKARELRKKYNTAPDGFVAMVKKCSGLEGVGDERFPRFPGEGLAMLYQPLIYSPECDTEAARAAKFFVDVQMRRSPNSSVQTMYASVGTQPSGLQEFEDKASVTLKNLEKKISDLTVAIAQNKASDANTCASLKTGEITASKDPVKPDPAKTPPGAGDGKTSEAKAAEVRKGEEDAAAKAADGKGKLNGKGDGNPVIANGTNGVGANATAGILADKGKADEAAKAAGAKDKDGNSIRTVETDPNQGKALEEANRLKAEAESRNSAAAADRIAKENAATQEREASAAAKAEADRREAERAASVTGAQQPPSPSVPAPAPANVVESSGIGAGGALLGIAALGAVGGGVYLLTKKKSSSSSDSFVGPMPASVPTSSAATASAATALAMASDTATSTTTSIATAAQTSSGVIISMPTATATATATAEASAPATSTATGTSTAAQTATATVTSKASEVPESGINFGPRGSGGVNKGVITGTGATMYVPTAHR